MRRFSRSTAQAPVGSQLTAIQAIYAREEARARQDKAGSSYCKKEQHLWDLAAETERLQNEEAAADSSDDENAV